VKKSDIATIILIASLSTLVAYFIANAVLGDPNDEKVEVEYMNVVAAEVEEPDPEVFNVLAINPTVEVIIGEDKPTDEGEDAPVSDTGVEGEE
jgi:hypothetical protein